MDRVVIEPTIDDQGQVLLSLYDVRDHEGNVFSCGTYAGESNAG